MSEHTKAQFQQRKWIARSHNTNKKTKENNESKNRKKEAHLHRQKPQRLLVGRKATA